MNLVEKLIKADAKAADEREVGVFKSRRLAKILGMKEKGTVAKVAIAEVPPRRVNEIVATQVDKKGDFDFTKSYDAKLIMCIEGVTDPNLRDKDLQAHFGVSTAKELCEKLFGSEVTDLSDAIAALSGVSAGEDTEEEVKN